MSFFPSVNSFWTVLKNLPDNINVTNTINKINSRKKVHSICTLDFSTFSINKNHDKLKFVFWELLIKRITTFYLTKLALLLWV